jgi:hypothetical protein
MWGSHRDGCEEQYVLGRDAVQAGRISSSYQRGAASIFRIEETTRAYLTYFSTLRMEAIFYFETSRCF